MKIPKPSEADKERFIELVPEAPNVDIKPMFGNVAGFVNGNMFMGLFGPSVGVRLDESARAELAAVEGTGPFGPEERPMKEYVTLPAAWLDSGAAEADEWIERALRHVAALPPKVKKSKKSSAK